MVKAIGNILLHLIIVFFLGVDKYNCKSEDKNCWFCYQRTLFLLALHLATSQFLYLFCRHCWNTVSTVLRKIWSQQIFPFNRNFPLDWRHFGLVDKSYRSIKLSINGIYHWCVVQILRQKWCGLDPNTGVFCYPTKLEFQHDLLLWYMPSTLRKHPRPHQSSFYCYIKPASRSQVSYYLSWIVVSSWLLIYHQFLHQFFNDTPFV